MSLELWTIPFYFFSCAKLFTFVFSLTHFLEHSPFFAIVSCIFVLYWTIYLSIKTDLLKDISTSAKKPYSFSRFQLIWWTAIISCCYIILYSLKREFNLLNDSCLILLGIGLGTSATGRVIDNVQDGLMHGKRHQDIPSVNFITDLISDDYGVSVHRFQALLFTLILGVTFVIKFFSNFELPIFGTQELALLGISSSAYLVFKFNENSKPVISEPIQTEKEEDVSESSTIGGATATTNFDVEAQGLIPIIQQPKSMDCWATVGTMMLSWKESSSYDISDVMQRLGPEYINYFNTHNGLPTNKVDDYLAKLGLAGEPPSNLTIERIKKLISQHGALWINADENRTSGFGNFALHARIVIRIKGNGTSNGTKLTIIDPATGTKVEETFTTFINKYEQVVTDYSQLFKQVIHY